MESKVKSMGHPMHPMLVNFPLGLLVTAAIFDIVHLITGNGYWHVMQKCSLLLSSALRTSRCCPLVIHRLGNQ